MFSKTKTVFPVAIAIRTGVSTMNWSTARTFRFSCWSEVKRCFAEWHLRARSRSELITLNDLILRDIGVSHFDAKSEASKPFWMA
jgi:uncharacterized protein YjiS (DUF1127 family)